MVYSLKRRLVGTAWRGQSVCMGGLYYRLWDSRPDCNRLPLVESGDVLPL